MTTNRTRHATRTFAAWMLAVTVFGLVGAALAGPANATAGPTRITIAAETWAFSMPATISAGLVDITITGGQQVDASVGRLNPGVSRSKAIAAAASGQQGALAAVLTPAGGPGGAGKAEGILKLTAGTYLVYSINQGPTGKPTVKYRFLTVGAASVPQAEPRSDVTIRERDMKFLLSGAVPAGRDTLKIVNDGPSAHETVIARLDPGKTFKDFMAYFSQPKPSGPPPGQMVGGANAAAAHQTQWLAETFTPGTYLVLCFLPDKHGQPHVMDGMYKTFTVR